MMPGQYEESCPNDGTKMHNEKAGIWCRGNTRKVVLMMGQKCTMRDGAIKRN